MKKEVRLTIFQDLDLFDRAISGASVVAIEGLVAGEEERLGSTAGKKDESLLDFLVSDRKTSVWRAETTGQNGNRDLDG
jgi:hypothetical protein